MFWVELILVLAIIFLGVRKGGTFLAMAGGVGMLIMTFFFHVTPADPPVTVILIMIAVIVAAATMQACGGLDFLVRIAEKILRRNPRMITVLAPVVAYIFTFMCGTGHIIYSLLPVAAQNFCHNFSLFLTQIFGKYFRNLIHETEGFLPSVFLTFKMIITLLFNVGYNDLFFDFYLFLRKGCNLFLKLIDSVTYLLTLFA